MRAGLLLLGLLLSTLSRAEEAPGNYEARLVEWALSLHGREVEPAPDGKRIDEILIASEDVISRTDPYPGFVNWFHARTRPDVIRRELLFSEGEVYDPGRAAETERNLRGLSIIALARVVPVKSARPDAVTLLVVTKDIWSLRPHLQWSYAGNFLHYLQFQPTERNLLGRHQSLSLDFFLSPDQLMAGSIFREPRLLGSRVGVVGQAAAFFNRRSGGLEGSLGGVTVNQPLYSLTTERGFTASATWHIRRVRNYCGTAVCLRDDEVLGVQLPEEYDQRLLTGSAVYTRSYGRDLKVNVSGGLAGYARRYRAATDIGLTDEQRLALEQRHLPRTETAVYFTGSVNLYEPRYVVLRDVVSFAVSEDWRLGPSALVHARWASPLLFSPSRFAELGARASYRWYRWDDLLAVSVAGAVRFVPGATGTGVYGQWVNRKLAAEVINYSPPLGPGRVVARGLVYLRYDDINSVLLRLGGENGLRGAPLSATRGPHEVLFNLEYRTRPVDLLTLHVGGVAFVDAGAAFAAQVLPLATVGLGLRLLFPQFDIEPIRIDFGWVIHQPPGTPALRHWTERLSTTFGHVPELRPEFLDDPL